jgi:hypothetical protein
MGENMMLEISGPGLNPARMIMDRIEEAADGQ